MIMNKTSIKHHIKHLEEQHRELDQKIKIEYIKYGNDYEKTKAAPER